MAENQASSIAEDEEALFENRGYWGYREVKAGKPSGESAEEEFGGCGTSMGCGAPG